MNEVLVIDDLEFEVRRSSRRKTLGLTVDRAGELVVHAPEAASRAELNKWVAGKLLWVHQKLLLKDEYRRANDSLELVSGECISYLGKNYRLKIVRDQTEPLRFDGHWFLLQEKAKPDAPGHFQRWYQNTGGEWLSKRVKSWGPRAGATAAKITVSDLGFRWGSCGKKGALHFNWRLLQLPVRLIDYVIVHEMAHLHQHNHTPEFWRILDRIMPDWQERKEELSHKRPEMVWGIEKDSPTKQRGNLDGNFEKTCAQSS